MSAEPKSIVIVGAGVAGLSTARALRSGGYDGTLTMIADESHLTYDRPPLSKHVLSGKWDPERTMLTTPEEVGELDLDLVLGDAVVATDVHGRVVETASGRSVPFDELVVATGVRPRVLPNSAATRYRLRTLDDSIALREQLRPGRHVALIGGGFLGLEIAATAVLLGCQVTVVSAIPAPLADRIGDRAWRRIESSHREHGVTFHFSRLVVSDEPHGQGRRLTLDDGHQFDADVVVESIGSLPNVEFLADSGLDLSNGIRVDAFGRSEIPYIWAAGDVANWFHPGLGASLRLEHRMTAGGHGNAVAAGILGTAVEHRPLPFFWTDQYDQKVQVAGMVSPHHESRIVHGDPESGGFVEVQYVGDDPVAVISYNAPRQAMPFRAQLEESTRVPGLWPAAGASVTPA